MSLKIVINIIALGVVILVVSVLSRTAFKNDFKLPVGGETKKETITIQDNENTMEKEIMVTDGVKHSVPLDSILGGGPPKDGIPSIDNPKFVSISEASKQLSDAEPGLARILKKGDIIIDGGNSFYKDSVRRGMKLGAKGIHFLDVGVSGGPTSIQLGKFAIMIGGDKKIYEKIKPIFDAMSDTTSGYVGKIGAGHFAKMIHNGIEYGMMQALAEGFSILKKAPFEFHLKDVASVYNQNSIITSRLTGWLEEGFQKYGEDLKKASGSVAHTGEGEWTVKIAKELGVPAPIIKESYLFRDAQKRTLRLPEKFFQRSAPYSAGIKYNSQNAYGHV